MHSDKDRAPRHARLATAVLPLMLALPVAAQAEEVTYDARIEAGHSAMWYDPARSGEGWMLEILPDDEAVLYWFTYDAEGKPRWLTSAGRIQRSDAGDEIRFGTLVAVRGPRFGSGFNPDDAVREEIGEAVMRFADCNTGEIAFDAYGRQGRFELTRLTRTMGARGCRPLHGTPGEPVQPYAGQSGSWYDPASSGQGFSLEWMADGTAALVWFTFDAEGNPYWMTATGQHEDGKIVFPNVVSSRGGRFADPFDPAAVTRTPWGRFELSLECDSGTGTYTPSASGFESGHFQLQRLTRLASPACPWVQPTLTDLYDLEWTDLPMLSNSADRPVENFQMTSMADDGAVVGVASWDGWSGVVRWVPGKDEWEKLLEGGVNPLITADGETIYARRQEAGVGGEVVYWTQESGWQPLLGLNSTDNRLTGLSQDGAWLLGAGEVESSRAVWKWKEGVGQISIANDTAIALAISDEGDVAVGEFRIGVSFRPMIWQDNQLRLLREDNTLDGSARACSADCGVMVGDDREHSTMPVFDPIVQPWYRTAKEGIVSLELPEGARGGSASEVSSDGSLIAGELSFKEGANAPVEWEGWLWAQDLGPVSLRAYLEQQFEFTPRWDRHVMDMSSDGQRILFTGVQRAGAAVERDQYRAAILRLTPRDPAQPQPQH